MVWIILAITLVVGIIIAFLPVLLRAKLNGMLGGLEGFTGSVERVRINLVASKVVISDLRVEHRDATPGQVPIVYIPHLRVLFRWKALLRQTFDLTLRAENPEILLTVKAGDAFINTPAPPTAGPANLKNIIEPLTAFRIDLEVVNGTFRYINAAAHPAVDLTISALQARLQDFTNRGDITHSSPIHASGILYNGKIALHAHVQSLADTLTFDLNAAVRAVDLPLLNDYLRRYARVDVSAGTLDVYAELTVANNVFQGHVTPILKNLDFRNAADQQDSFLQKVWERTVSTAIRFLANRRKGEIATRIPIRGTLDNPNVNVATALIGIFKNAFIRSIRPSLTNVISLRTLFGKSAE